MGALLITAQACPTGPVRNYCIWCVLHSSLHHTYYADESGLAIRSNSSHAPSFFTSKLNSARSTHPLSAVINITCPLWPVLPGPIPAPARVYPIGSSQFHPRPHPHSQRIGWYSGLSATEISFWPAEPSVSGSGRTGLLMSSPALESQRLRLALANLMKGFTHCSFYQ